MQHESKVILAKLMRARSVAANLESEIVTHAISTISVLQPFSRTYQEVLTSHNAFPKMFPQPQNSPPNAQVQGGLCATTSLEPVSNISMWDVSASSWRPRATYGDADMLYANSMSFERGQGVMVAGCGDQAMRVWDLET